MSNEKPDSLRETIARHSRDLLRFLTRRVGSRDAPDLVQETILRVMRHSEHETIVEPAALLHSTAANLARDHARRRRTESKFIVHGLEIDDLFTAAPTPEARLDAEESMARFLAALDALTPKCRQVFIMRRFEDLHQEEIARRLGISRNMVEKHLRTAFKQLREALK